VNELSPPEEACVLFKITAFRLKIKADRRDLQEENTRGRELPAGFSLVASCGNNSLL